MENKFYTPELEEFHVGFEYEFNDCSNNDWQKAIIKDGTQIDDITRKENGISVYSLRVKHLDREDIESLGFKKSKLDNSVYLYFEKIRIMPHLDKTTIGLNFNEGNTHCLIFFVPDENNIPAGINLFVGKIRNKSELRKLMKQLNISKQ